MANSNHISPRLLLAERKPLLPECHMIKRCLTAVAALMMLIPLPAMGQWNAADLQEDNGTTGHVWHNYTVQQSIEFGGRIVGIGGNEQMYDTLVNLHSGPRLLDQELTMTPMTRGEGLFDSLYVSSFGFGGDPNDLARLRIEKSKWYNFVGLYRRDQNYFNDNLFANPLTLNPGITNCSTVAGGAVVPCGALFNPQASYFYTNSPHLQDTVRNMGDFNLTLLPLSPVSVRLGFARYDNNGIVDSSLEDVAIDLTEYSQVRSDRWSFGVDAHLLPRTTLSFDQFFERDKVDISFVNNPVDTYSLGVGGPSVSIPFYFPPCSVTVAGLPEPYITNPGVLNPLCNTGVFAYSRSANVRSWFPTSQLSFRSNLIPRLDITAAGTYSSGNSKVFNYNDIFIGLISRTNNTAYQVTGPANTNRVSGNADLGFTYHITKQWNISDRFRWLDWRSPGDFNQLTNNCYSNLAAGATLSTPTGAPCTVPGVTATTGVAPAGLTALSAVSYSTLLAQRTYFNTMTLNWTPSRRIGAFVGYRYGRREYRTDYLAATTNSLTVAGGLVGSPGATTVSNRPLSTDTINLHTALVGVVFRPTEKLRVNIDAELLSADNGFTQIAPRHEQRVRANGVYKINSWSSLNASVHFIESRNNWAENFGGPGVNLFPITYPRAYGTISHDRYYTIGASLQPNWHATFDFGWTYMDQYYNIPACMVLSSASVVAGGAPTVCPVTTNQPTIPATLNVTAAQFTVPVTQDYQENTNSGYAILMIRPIHRVAVNVSYDVTSTAGYVNWLRADNGLPLQVLGDVYGNVPGIPGNPGTAITGATTSAGTISFLGPFPDQPLGSQDFNWHKLNAGLAVEIAKGVAFRGNFGYYNYNEKEGNIPPEQLVVLPRNFHTNIGTLALRYAF